MNDRPVLPLFAWSDARRAARKQRRRLALRALLTVAGCGAVAATILAPPLPRLVWNASRSAPLGLYRVAPGASLHRGNLVIARTPAAVRGLAARRHYIPDNVPLVKRVAAVAGERVCAVGSVITIDTIPVARRRATDRLGRPLPWWRGCRTLADGSVFLLMAGVADSFDGRYFGPTPASDVIGRATPLWLR